MSGKSLFLRRPEVGEDLSIEDNPELPTCLAEELAYETIGEENIGGRIHIVGNSAECPD